MTSAPLSSSGAYAAEYRCTAIKNDGGATVFMLYFVHRPVGLLAFWQREFPSMARWWESGDRTFRNKRFDELWVHLDTPLGGEAE